MIVCLACGGAGRGVELTSAPRSKPLGTNRTYDVGEREGWVQVQTPCGTAILFPGSYAIRVEPANAEAAAAEAASTPAVTAESVPALKVA